MEKKEPIKISLPVFITIIVLLVAIVCGFYMYMQNEKLEEEIADLRNNMNQIQVEKNELQEKLNNISNIASTAENETTIDTEKDKETKVKETNTIIQEITGPGYNAKLKDDNITITVLAKNGLWMDSDFNKTINYKTYSVSGLKNGIKKIAAVNRGYDVSPEIFVLMNNGEVYSIDISAPIINIKYGTNDVDDIKFKCEKVNEYKDIVDIYGYEDGHYVLDKNGNKIMIFDENR